MEEQVYKIALSGNDINLIIQALGNCPLKDVVNVYDTIRSQGKAQDQAFREQQQAKQVQAIQDASELESLRKQFKAAQEEIAKIHEPLV